MQLPPVEQRVSTPWFQIVEDYREVIDFCLDKKEVKIRSDK